MDAERSSDGLGADRDEVREALPEDAGVGLGFAEDLEAVLASDDDHEHVVRIRVRRAVDYSAARLCANEVGFKNGGTTNLTQVNLTTTAGPFNWTEADENVTNAVLGSNWCRGTNGLGVEFRGTYDFDYFKPNAIRLLDYCSPSGSPACPAPHP